MAKRRKRYFFKIIFAAAAVIFAFTWINVQKTKLGYKIEKSRKEIVRIKTANQSLYHKIQIELSSAKLQENAVKMGMVYPEPDSIVILPDNEEETANQGWLAKILDFTGKSS